MMIEKMDKKSNPSRRFPLHSMVLGSACYRKEEAFERKFIVLNEITFSYCIAVFFCFLKVILTIKLRGKTEKEEDRH